MATLPRQLGMFDTLFGQTLEQAQVVSLLTWVKLIEWLLRLLPFPIIIIYAFAQGNLSKVLNKQVLLVNKTNL